MVWLVSLALPAINLLVAPSFAGATLAPAVLFGVSLDAAIRTNHMVIYRFNFPILSARVGLHGL